MPEQKEPTRQIAVLPAQADPEQQQHFDAADRVGSRAAFDAFLAKYPSGALSDLARAKRDKLASADSPAGPKRIAVLPAPGQAAGSHCRGRSRRAAAARSPTSAAVARDLQTELRRVGCDPGAVNGVWSANSRQALEQFNRRAGMNLDTKVASVDALDAVKGQRGRICPLVCGSGQRADGERCVAIPAPPKVAAQAGRPCASRSRARANERARSRYAKRRCGVSRWWSSARLRFAPGRRFRSASAGIGIGIGGIGIGF